jgi:hypothetical protein
MSQATSPETARTPKIKIPATGVEKQIILRVSARTAVAALVVVVVAAVGTVVAGKGTCAVTTATTSAT